jgi:antitoxin component of RelBE/YafQ-DinJ toxin-antitoxin module
MFVMSKTTGQWMLIDKIIPEYILWYMKTTMLIKMDKKLKDDVQKAAKAVGLPLSTIVTGYLKQFVAEKSITFSAPMPNAKTIKIIRQAEKDFKEGKTAGPFSSMEEAVAYLQSTRKRK